MAPNVRSPLGAQRSFDELSEELSDELASELSDVTFCVLDLETTGGSPQTDTITEIGAIKVRGGESLGTFQTLVNPGRAIPPSITVLTGITESMVIQAPRIESVLGSLVDFIGDAVVVGHNIRFDMGFIQAALARDERPAATNTTVDTVPLARRLLRDEVPNCRLGTLAERLRLPNRPSHRALDDALATADLLHVLIERAGRLGVSGLDDLKTLPTLAGSEHAAKLRLTERLPRTPGVYLFRDGAGRVLYVGKATNLRARVRQYFSSDTRRKIGSLLRETERIDHKRTSSPLEASVLEHRLICELTPRFNRAGTNLDRAVYVRLDPAERFARLKVVKGSGGSTQAIHLGPISSRRVAHLVVEAVHSALPLRQCTSLPGRSKRSGACLPAQLGLAACPCSGEVTPEMYRPVVDRAVDALTAQPDAIVGPLTERMLRLAGEERFEEAAAVRDRLAAFEATIERQRRLDRLRATERFVVHDDGISYVFERGVLTAIGECRPPQGTSPDAAGALPLDDLGMRPVQARPSDPGPPGSGPIPAALAEEIAIVSRWLDTRPRKS